jgi:hypothetical protein
VGVYDTDGENNVDGSKRRGYGDHIFLYRMLVSYLYLRFSEYIALEVVLCPAHLCGMLRSLVRSKI